MMQRPYAAPAQEPWGRQAPASRFTEDEITAFIEEVAGAKDRETFNKLTARFDAQFIAKFKARFPGQTGKFPFGSAGKPYTYGGSSSYAAPPAYNPGQFAPPAYNPGQAAPPQSFYPMQQSYSYDRPMSAAAAPQTNQYSYPPGDQFYPGAQYQARTPSPSHVPMASQRFEQPAYNSASYDRPPQPAYPSYLPEPQPPIQSSRFQDSSFGRQPSPSKPPNSFSDFAELRKMKEEMLARFQVGNAGQRPPRA